MKYAVILFGIVFLLVPCTSAAFKWCGLLDSPHTFAKVIYTGLWLTTPLHIWIFSYIEKREDVNELIQDYYYWTLTKPLSVFSWCYLCFRDKYYN